MAVYPSGKRLYSKIRLVPGGKGRRTYQLAAGLDEAGGALRDALLADLGAQLVAHGQDLDRVVDPILTKLAVAVGGEAERIERYIRTRLLPGKRRVIEEAPTVRQFGEWWTNGELARRFPGQVEPRKGARKDAQDLARYVYPSLGDLLVSAVRLEHLETVLRGLPAGMARSTKGKILRKVRRLLSVAVYPAKLLEFNPMPKGFCPAPGRAQFPILYPGEEARLLACEAIPVVRRVAYGLAARTGLRLGEVCALRWRDVDLERGALRLPQHKTVGKAGARIVPLDPATVQVLAWWQGVSGDGERVLPVSSWIGTTLLPDLLAAGVTRGELHQAEEGSRVFSFHGLRRTFVTLSLGDGRTEDWVMRRTGHTTSAQLQRYRVAAANAAEFRLGWLLPFDAALPETADRVTPPDCPEVGKNPEESRVAGRSLRTLGEQNEGDRGQKSAESEGVAGGKNSSGQGADRLRRVSCTSRVSDLRPSRLLTRRAA